MYFPNKNIEIVVKTTICYGYHLLAYISPKTSPSNPNRRNNYAILFTNIENNEFFKTSQQQSNRNVTAHSYTAPLLLFSMSSQIAE